MNTSVHDIEHKIPNSSPIEFHILYFIANDLDIPLYLASVCTVQPDIIMLIIEVGTLPA